MLSKGAHIIELTKDMLISSGKYRNVFQHPKDDELVIKIGKKVKVEKKDLYSQKRELSFYKKLTNDSFSRF